MSSPFSRAGVRAAVWIALSPALPAALTACSSDVNPMKAAFMGVGQGPKDVQAPDFIASSRRRDGDYMPVGESAPRRPVRARSSEGQKALEAELENARSRNEARGRAAEGAGKAAGGSPAPNP